MKKYFIFLVAAVLACGCLSQDNLNISKESLQVDANLTGVDQTTGNETALEVGVDVYFFYSPSCPHCIREKAFLEGIEGEYPDARIHYLIASENRDLFAEMSSAYNTTTSGVPRTFIGDKAFVGFSPEDCGLNFYKDYGAYGGCPNQIKEAIKSD